ncbi:MAG: septum formation initiator family protein [Clostridia bacterium]|nr:septum formation initiator family protein [Clostridia bacterium]
MRKFFGRLLATLTVMGLLFYAGCVLIEQEKQMKSINNEKEKYASLIDEASLRTEELKEIKAKINTDEYIEQYAREKLGLVMPYEIIFVDASI